MVLKINDNNPEFKTVTHSGETIDSELLKGKKIYAIFLP